MKQQKGYQYIMQHDKVIFSSPDKVSIKMLWNNITGKNFKGKDITGKIQTPAQHHVYIEMMKNTGGLPAGYIQLQLKPGVTSDEYRVPDSTNLDTAKKEHINSGGSIMFGSATKYSDIFIDDTRKNITEKALECAKRFTDRLYYFQLFPRDAGHTIVRIEANGIISSRVLAIIETSSIPEVKETVAEPVVVKSEPLTAKKVLSMCNITYDHIVKLPDIKLDKKIYDEVKSIIDKNGGKWKGGKTQGFQFGFDPTELFEKLQSGEEVNNKKEFQFFATPDEVINLMITKASLEKTDVVLEPSAGQGAIVDRILPLCKEVHLCELMPENRQILEKKGYTVMGGDFLALNDNINENIKYNKIIANPPFSKNQDIDHVRKMYAMLKKGGRLVSIMSTSWMIGTQKKQEEFKIWLREIGASFEVIDEGAFKKSGTNVKTAMVTIDKI